MIFYFKADGTPIGAILSRIYSGSVNANTVYLICPTRGAQVNAVFELPDGSTTYKLPMQNVGEEENAVFTVEEYGLSYYGYEMALPVAATVLSGEVSVQFYIQDGNGTTVTTPKSVFTVEEGVTPRVLTEDATYDQISECIASINAVVEKVNDEFERAVNSAYRVHESIIKTDGQLVAGKFNSTDYPDAPFMIGNGLSEDMRRCSVVVDRNGYMHLTNSPFSSTHAVNKFYLDSMITNVNNKINETFGKKVEIAETETTITEVINKNIYCLNEMTSVTLCAKAGELIGDKFYIMFTSGDTPTNLTIDLTNAVLSSEIIPERNRTVEISGVWNGEKWIILSNQVAVA